MEFPPYGLDTSWVGPRWIEAFGGKIGDPVAWALLAHQAPESRSAVFVYTLDRAPLDAHADRHGLDRLAEAANVPAIGLVNLTLPELSVPRPDGMLKVLVAHANDRSSHYAEWPEISWRVDGVTVAARVWRFADGWAAFSDALPDVYLTAAGIANEPDGLQFARLPNGDAYGFDLADRLSIGVLNESRAVGGVHELVDNAVWHRDQLRLLADN